MAKYRGREVKLNKPFRLSAEENKRKTAANTGADNKKKTPKLKNFTPILNIYIGSSLVLSNFLRLKIKGLI